MNAMDGKLKALSDPTRREILRRTWDQELPAGHLADGFTMSRPAVSQHLRVLREAGLVTVRKEGAQRLYTARPAALADVLQFFEDLWERHLPELKSAAEAAGRRRAAAEEGSR